MKSSDGAENFSVMRLPHTDSMPAPECNVIHWLQSNIWCRRQGSFMRDLMIVNRQNASTIACTVHF